MIEKIFFVAYYKIVYCFDTIKGKRGGERNVSKLGGRLWMELRLFNYMTGGDNIGYM